MGLRRTPSSAGRPFQEVPLNLGGPFSLLVLPFNDFRKGQQQGFRDRDNHLLEQLLASSELFHSVLVVDRPTPLLEWLSRRRPWHVDAGRPTRRGFDFRLSRIRSNFVVLNHLDVRVVHQAALRRAWWSTAYGSKRLTRLVSASVRGLGMEDYSVLLHHPFGIQVVRAMHYRSFVFDAVDNFMKIPHFQGLRSAMAPQYREIEARADALIAVTEQAGNSLFGERQRFHVVPNGVEPAYFRQWQGGHGIAGLQEERRIRVGYVGTIAQRFDVGLVARVAELMPEAVIYVVGPVVDARPLKRFAALPNVVVVGNVHYGWIPSILRDLDVCIVPHRVGEAENDGDAIKTYEYIAAGKPVITTPILGHQRFVPYVMVATTAEGFVESLRSLKESNFRAEYPTTLLSDHRWEARFRAIMTIVSQSRMSPNATHG